MVTPPTHEGSVREREISPLGVETSQSQRVKENCRLCEGCDATWVKETTQAKHIEPNNRVETPSSCYSRVQTTTLGELRVKLSILMPQYYTVPGLRQ